jgi:hypothetical protein
MRLGTAHFISKAAARRYYIAQGDETPNVDEKLAAGVIHIGRPKVNPGERAFVHRSEGRWFIETKEA